MYPAFSVQSVSEDIHKPSDGILSIAVFQLKRKMENDKIRSSYFNPNAAVDLGNHHERLLNHRESFFVEKYTSIQSCGILVKNSKLNLSSFKL